MSKFLRVWDRFKGLNKAIIRFPITTAFLMVAAVIMGISIQTDKEYMKLILSLLVGAVLNATLQMVWERFFGKSTIRYALMGLGLVLTLLYYFLIRTVAEFSIEIGIRTAVTIFMLSVAFLWVPVIRSMTSFNESFMAGFKSFFHSLLYAVVMFAGSSLIISAFDLLIMNVSEKAYPHTANIIFVLFAPIFFLSLIPVYPGKRDREAGLRNNASHYEIIKKAAFCPKFLEVLLSYIIIPLLAVFTVILILYIGINIRSEFWTNNLLEPMLVAYAVAVILVYILSSRLENKLASLFRRIIPKVMIPIVLFQITASYLLIRETGITYGRYFVILFGIFAASAGVVMCLVSVRKNGIIAAMLIVFSAVSVIPPVDAFTVSRLNQVKILKTVLVDNGMLKDGTIIPNNALSDTDKKKLLSSVRYLERMGYINDISWMPENYKPYEDFYDTFGFRTDEYAENNSRSVYVSRNRNSPIAIENYDVLTHTFINSEDGGEDLICNFEKDGHKYEITKVKDKDQYDILLLNESKQELARLSVADIFTRFEGNAAEKTQISSEEATFTTENANVKLTIIIEEANYYTSFNQTNYFADFYILVDVK